MTSIAVDPLDPLRVYAATAHGLFVSGDEGETWKPLAHGLLGHFVGALAIEPGHSGALYVGTNEGGLLRAGAGGTGETGARAAVVNTRAARPARCAWLIRRRGLAPQPVFDLEGSLLRLLERERGGGFFAM